MRSLILAVLTLLDGSTLAAQRAENRVVFARSAEFQATPAPVRVLPVGQVAMQPDPGRMFASGLGTGLLLGVAGGFVGYGIGKNCDYCDLGYAVIGALVGEVVGVPIGVRRAGGRGSLVGQTFVSGGVMALGIMAAPMSMGISLLAAIPFQVGLVVRAARMDETTRTEVLR